MLNSSKVNDEFYRKIHYLTREFHVKLHAKTDIAIRAISVFKCNLMWNSQELNRIIE